jgi:hypothetical protein
MKWIRWVVLGLAALSLGACDRGPKQGDGATTSAAAAATARATASGPRTLDPSPGADGATVADCEAYVKALERCVNQMPKENRGPMQAQLDKQREALKVASPAEKQAMASGCQMGLASLKQNPACP